MSYVGLVPASAGVDRCREICGQVSQVSHKFWAGVDRCHNFLGQVRTGTFKVIHVYGHNSVPHNDAADGWQK